MGKFYKSVSIILTITMLLTLVPLSVVAKSSSANVDMITESTVTENKPISGTIIEDNVLQQDMEEEPNIIGEVEEKREKNVKHFLRDDMTFEVAVYPSTVHYMDEEGKWKDIDNTLEEKKDENGNDVLENKANDFKVKIAKKADAKNLIRIQKGKYEVSWNFEGANKVKSEVVSEEVEESLNISKNDKKKALTHLTSKVDFKDILPDVDLQYQLNADGIKENIILNKRIESPVFDFIFDVKGLTPEFDGNTIVFYDEKDKSNAIFKIQAPFMMDAKHEYSDKIQINMEKIKKEYIIRLMPDKEWLESSERVYPIVIDPWVTTSQYSPVVKDATVLSSLPTTNDNDSDISVHFRADLETRSYISFTLPQLSSDAQIVEANMALVKYSSYSSGKCGVTVYGIIKMQSYAA